MFLTLSLLGEGGGEGAPGGTSLGGFGVKLEFFQNQDIFFND